jgi:hypothetical protein
MDNVNEPSLRTKWGKVRLVRWFGGPREVYLEVSRPFSEEVTSCLVV